MSGPDTTNKKAPRLPRWTRQEILVLIQGKRVAETRLSEGRVLGPDKTAESKWATVSAYCKRHGVNRGPVQCRKRWSNLAGDYKKIRDWESGMAGTDSESFWVMRNDFRRERRLPGFFDKEVYDILEAQVGTQENPTAVGLVLALGRCSTTKEEEDMAAAEEEEAEGEAVFFDSGRSAAAEEGMFSDSEEPLGRKEYVPSASEIPAPVPISEQQYQPYTKGPSSQGTSVGKQDGFNPKVGDTSGKGRKRKRSAASDTDDKETNMLQHQLISVLEKNGEMLSAQLQSQNTNSQLDREQRKDHMDSLVAFLGKLADTLGRIVDKL